MRHRPVDRVLESLQRKANILSEIYEMSKALGAVFDLDRIFAKATDIIFASTPADRVVALLAEERLRTKRRRRQIVSDCHARAR